MKKCFTCQEEKPVDDFHWRVKGVTRSGRCKPCQNAAMRSSYRRNRTKRIEASIARNKKNREANIERLNAIKNVPCADCRRRFHWCATQFDHVRGDKVGNISDMVRNGTSWAKLEAEVAKCDVVCANCHAMRTHVRRMTVKPWR